MYFQFLNRLIGTITPVSTFCFLLFTFIVSSGAASQCPPQYIFTGEAAEDFFGITVASAGDVNNDGYTDLIVGAVLNDAGGLQAGRAYVFSGLNGDTLHVFTGEAAGDGFGSSVASAGDVNGDGYADLIVGAPFNGAGGFHAGRAYVFSGLNGDTLYVYTGEATRDGFGESVASAGDVNDDGYADLIVGANSNDAGGLNAGRAYVFSGLDGDTLHVFTGKAVDERFGLSVASAGDVNDDGYADLIVGAPSITASGRLAGRAHVFSGLNGDALYVFIGEAGGDWFGRSVASAGDVNRDGFDDLIVGALFNDAGGDEAGRAYVFSGQTGDTLYVFTGEAVSNDFGISVASAGDVNNDGYADLIVGANRNDAGGENAGRAYVFSGQNGDTLFVFTGEAAVDFFGWSVASAGDVNDDGYADLIVGAWRNDAGGNSAGRAYVYSGRPCGAVIHVPADQPTIQAGIDAAIHGDTVLVADGTYTGHGNRDIDFHGKSIVLESENGPDFTIIDCQGDSLDPHRGFNFHNGEDTLSKVFGFEIRNGFSQNFFSQNFEQGGAIRCSTASPVIRNCIFTSNSSVRGGAIYCKNSSSPRIEFCEFNNNFSNHYGGSLYIEDDSDPSVTDCVFNNCASGAHGGSMVIVRSSPTIKRCVVSRPHAPKIGGAVFIQDGSIPLIENCTFYGASGGVGSSFFIEQRSGQPAPTEPVISQCIISFGTDDQAVRLSGTANPTFTCTDIYGTSEGDWTPKIVNHLSQNGNLSADPLFCDEALGDYHLKDGSPCAPANNSCGELIGALGVECLSTDVSPDEAIVLPKNFTLEQNHPNPFNPTTVISYSLPVKAGVTVVIYNVLGQKVKVFNQGQQSAGKYSVIWDATDEHGKFAASGIYFYRVQAGEFVASRKMLLLK